MDCAAWPTDYRIETQEFGVNEPYYRKYGLPGHNGVDIRAPLGTPFYAVWPGQVVYVSDRRFDGDPSGYGWHIRIMTDDKTLIYGHAAPWPPVEAGNFVEAGDLIGYSGNTGDSYGPHLHLELRQCPGDPGWPWCIRDITPILDAIE